MIGAIIIGGAVYGGISVITSPQQIVINFDSIKSGIFEGIDPTGESKINIISGTNKTKWKFKWQPKQPD